MYLWRAVDQEGEILDMLVQRRRDKRAAVKLMRKLIRKHGFAPRVAVTDKLRSYGAAFQALGLTCRHEQGLLRSPFARSERNLPLLTPFRSTILTWKSPGIWRLSVKTTPPKHKKNTPL